ncbi:MAG TPA: phage tail protein [Phycisphaerae bacterium]|nr:phage tail protein [Phycisphaerae bacterium]
MIGLRTIQYRSARSAVASIHGVQISVDVDPARLAELAEELEGITHGVPRVLTRALNKVAAHARAQVVRAVRRVLNVKAGELRRRNVTLRKAHYDRLAASVHITGRRIPLRSFAARQTRRGVSYAIGPGRRKVLAGSFLAVMPSGHRGAFARRKRSRLPIVEQFGPSVPAVVEGIEELGQAALEQSLGTRLEGEVDTQLGLVLARHGRANR